MTAPMFEIGVVYKKNSRYYLAVTPRVLISFKNREVFEVKPYAKYEVVRHISVDDLCRRWGIGVERLDGQTTSYLSPSPEGVKPRPRGRKGSRFQEDQTWRIRRTIRMAS